MTRDDHHTEISNGDLSLRDLILKVGEYIQEVLRYWWIVVLAVILAVALVFYKRATHELNYVAKIKFVIEGHMPSGSGLGGLLGTLGMSKPGQVNPFKVIETSRGSYIFNKIALRQAAGSKLLGNRVIDTYGLDTEWGEVSPRFEGARISPKVDTSRLQLEIVKKLHRFIYGADAKDNTALSRLTLDEDTGVYTLTSSTLSHDLSLDLTYGMYEELKFFFEDEVFQNQRRLAEILDAKADSLQYLRDYKVRQLAKFENQNRGMISKDIIAERAIIRMEQEVINRAYAEIKTTREMTDVNMKDQKPLFIAIDQPFLPLYPMPFLLIRNLILYSFLGGLLASIFIVGRKVFKDIMTADE